MKNFTILYRWQDRHYRATVPGRDAAAALSVVNLTPGARVYGVEVAA